MTSTNSHIGFFLCQNYQRAIRYLGHSDGTMGGWSISSPGLTQNYYPDDNGNNAFLFSGVSNMTIGPGTGSDSGEHFIRFGDGACTAVTMGDMVLARTGLAAVKINCGVAYDRASDLQFGLIDATDVGTAGGDQAAILRFSHCDTVTVERAIGRKSSGSTAACLYGIQGTDWNAVTINSLSCPDFQNAIRFDSQYDIGQGTGPSGSNYNAYGPVLNSYIKLESGSATSGTLIQLAMPNPDPSDPTSTLNCGVSGLTIELAVPALLSGQNLLNLNQTVLDGQTTVSPPHSPPYTQALGGGIDIVGSVGGAVAPVATFGNAPEQWAYTRFATAHNAPTPPSDVWRKSAPLAATYEQLCAIETVLDHWTRTGLIGGASPKLTGLSVFATIGLQRQLMNILDRSGIAAQLFPWSTNVGTATIVDNQGITSLNNPSSSLSALFPSAGFVGIHVLDSVGSDPDFDFGTPSTLNNVFRFNCRNAAGVPTFKIGGSANLTVSGAVGDSTGFWGMTWDSASWQITRNGVAVGSTGTFATAPSMPNTALALGNNSGNYSTRRHGLMVYGPQKLAVSDVATIYADVQRIMGAVGL